MKMNANTTIEYQPDLYFVAGFDGHYYIINQKVEVRVPVDTFTILKTCSTGSITLGEAYLQCEVKRDLEKIIRELELLAERRIITI